MLRGLRKVKGAQPGTLLEYVSGQVQAWGDARPGRRSPAPDAGGSRAGGSTHHLLFCLEGLGLARDSQPSWNPKTPHLYVVVIHPPNHAVSGIKKENVPNTGHSLRPMTWPGLWPFHAGAEVGARSGSKACARC